MAQADQMNLRGQIRVFFICLLFFMIIFLSALCVCRKDAYAAVPLTEDEIAWIAAHPVIRLAPDPEFRPIEYFDEKGSYVGMAADYAALIGKKLGIRFEVIKCSNWDDVIKRAQLRQVDVLNAVVKTPQREKFLLFPPPYLKIPSVIIVRKHENLRLTLDMLRGKKIVMVSGYGYVDLIRNRYPQLKIELVTDLKTALRMVSFDLADAFVGDLATASYYIELEGISNLRLSGETDPPNISGFAVRSDWPELAGILEKGTALITEDERKSIYRKWIQIETEPGLTMIEFRNIMLVIAGVAAVVLSLLLLWTRTLKRVVNLRTEDLRRELDERKRMEKLLADNETRLRTLLQTLPDMVWLKDRDGVYLFCNSMFERFFGSKEREIVGKNDYDFMESDLADFFRNHDRRAEEAGKSVINEEWVTFADDGHRALLETIKTPMIDAGGSFIGVLGIGRDITERKLAEDRVKESEKLLKEAQRMAHIGNWELDLSGNILSWSDEIYRIFEIDKNIFSASYKVFLECIHPDDRDAVDDAYRKSIADRAPYEITYRLLMADGRIKYVQEQCENMYSTDGRPVKSVGTVQDITELKQAENEIRTKNEELAAQNEEFEAINEELIASNRELHISEENLSRSLQEKETLIRELYHRTKNTMQVISWMLVLQADEYPESPEIQQIVRNTEERIQAISLVHQMLYQSRDLSRISIKDYVSELSEIIMRSFGVHDGRISLDLEIDEQYFLLDTAIPFGLILNELMTNSFKYAFPDNRNGIIRINLVKGESGHNMLNYSDNGVGVPDGFDFRKQNTMGLQLVYGIGERQMMGKVTMANSNGVTCQFEFHNNLYSPRV